jgi:hypothetical protein
MSHGLVHEFWKRDTEFIHFEVSNTGLVRNADTKVIVPVKGSGGKTSVQLVDKHGRRHDRNVRRLVRKLFGIAPIRIVEPVPAPQPPIITPPKTTTDEEKPMSPTPQQDQDDSWVTLRWPGVKGDHYRISRNGQVQILGGTELTGSRIQSGLGDYIVMNLMRQEQGDYSGHYVQVRLDELVAAHFIGPRPAEDYSVIHLDGDRMNSDADNLEWAAGMRQIIRRSPLAGSRPKRRGSGVRAKRARRLNGDPNWRMVTHAKVAPRQYWISRSGKARGVQDIDLAEFLREDGRVSVYMKAAETGNNTTVALDELVLEAFAGNRPTPKHKPMHRNGDGIDNHADNLYWGIPGQETPQPPVVDEPEPVITPTRAQVKITTLASYRIGDVEVIVNNGIIEPPQGGTAVQQAAALAQIYAEIAKGNQE